MIIGDYRLNAINVPPLAALRSPGCWRRRRLRGGRPSRPPRAASTARSVGSWQLAVAVWASPGRRPASARPQVHSSGGSGIGRIGQRRRLVRVLGVGAFRELGVSGVGGLGGCGLGSCGHYCTRAACIARPPCCVHVARSVPTCSMSGSSGPSPFGARRSGH